MTRSLCTGQPDWDQWFGHRVTPVASTLVCSTAYACGHGARGRCRAIDTNDAAFSLTRRPVKSLIRPLDLRASAVASHVVSIFCPQRDAARICPPLAPTADPLFWYFFGIDNKKAPSASARCLICLPNLVGANGLEPSTPTMSRWCSNQLSYAPEEPKSIAQACCNAGIR